MQGIFPDYLLEPQVWFDEDEEQTPNQGEVYDIKDYERDAE